MTPRSVAILAGLGVLSLAGGWYFGPGSAPPEQAALPGGALLFPGLAPMLKDAATIEVVHQGKTLMLRRQKDGAWSIDAFGGYPALETKLRGVLTGLTELRLTEARTSNLAQYPRLGVDDPAQPEATGDLLRVLDAGGKPVAAVIVGHRRMRSQGGVPEEVYVRRPSDAQAWLAQGTLSVDSDPAQWLDRALLNIPADKVQAVIVGDDALQFDRKDGSFDLRQPADHPKLDSYRVEEVSRALENLTMMAVKPVAEAPKDATGHATFLTGDGLAITATLFHADKDIWARFAAAGDNKAEAEALNARFGGWVFQIPAWKEKALVPTLDDLKAAEPAKPAASPAPPPAPGGGDARPPDGDAK